MAKIIKVGSQNITPNKIANPFRTTRNSTTNPFKYNNFEGNTLPFELAADVFSGTKTQNTNKFRLIATSVTGSMSKMKSSMAESIINFVNRVREAWDYAKVTPISQVPGVKHINEAMANIGDGITEQINSISERYTTISKGITSKMGYLGKDVTEIGQDIKTQWEAIIAKIPAKTRYTANTPVAELEAALKAELAMEVVA